MDRASMKITPSSSTFMLCVDTKRLVHLNCSIEHSNPPPLLTWSRLAPPENEILTDMQYQAPTGYFEMAHSVLTVDIWKLGVGTHVFRCDAYVNHWQTALYGHHVRANITVLPSPKWAISRCPEEGGSVGSSWVICYAVN